MPRSYAAQFRAMVIEQVRSGRKVAEVAATLELPASTVFRWVRQDNRPGRVAGTSTAESAELRAAKRRIGELEAELATVKRATELFDKAGWCAQKTSSPSWKPWPVRAMDQEGLSAPSGRSIGLLPMALDAAQCPGDPPGVAGRRHHRDPRAVAVDVRVATHPR